MSQKMIFKKCPMCATEWETPEDFICDPLLEINGYQANFEKLEWGLFYFTHQRMDCHTTMGIAAKNFLSLYSGKRYAERRTGMEDCPGYGLNQEQLDRCDAYCECAFNNAR